MLWRYLYSLERFGKVSEGSPTLNFTSSLLVVTMRTSVKFPTQNTAGLLHSFSGARVMKVSIFVLGKVWEKSWEKPGKSLGKVWEVWDKSGKSLGHDEFGSVRFGSVPGAPVPVPPVRFLGGLRFGSVRFLGPP